MEILVNNWDLVLIFVAIIAAVVFLVKNDKTKAKKWLLYAVLEAERQFGSKTGQVKLSYVYSWFIQQYPVLSKFITFEAFSKLVDQVLEEMRHLIETNPAVKAYVDTSGVAI